jgi:hypothetical protein
MHWTIRLILSTPALVWLWATVLEERYNPIPPTELAVAATITIALIVWVFKEFIPRRED